MWQRGSACHYSETKLYVSHVCICCLQVVSEECSEEIQCCCLSLLHLATEHSITAYLEFEQHGGMALIQQVLRTPQASVGEQTLKVCTLHVRVLSIVQGWALVCWASQQHGFCVVRLC